MVGREGVRSMVLQCNGVKGMLHSPCARTLLRLRTERPQCRSVLTAFLLNQDLSLVSPRAAGAPASAALCIYVPKEVSGRNKPPVPIPRLPALAEPERSAAPRRRRSQPQQHDAKPGGAGDNITKVKYNRKSLQMPFQNSREGVMSLGQRSGGDRV